MNGSHNAHIERFVQMPFVGGLFITLGAVRRDRAAPGLNRPPTKSQSTNRQYHYSIVVSSADMFITQANGNREGGMVYTVVCLSVFPHYI